MESEIARYWNMGLTREGADYAAVLREIDENPGAYPRLGEVRAEKDRSRLPVADPAAMDEMKNAINRVATGRGDS